MCTTILLAASILISCEVDVTFYTRAEGWNDGSVTRSGIEPYEGIAASTFLPIGTRFYLWGEEYVVEDTGYLGENQIDIFFDGPYAIARGYSWLWEHRDDPAIITMEYAYEEQ